MSVPLAAIGRLLPLAHAGEGATWQALLTLLAIGLAGVVVLAAFGVMRIAEPGDLILPLAGTAVLASLSGVTNEVLSDWIGWGFPIGVTALVTLLVAALTPLALSWRTPLVYGAIVVALGAGLVFHSGIERAWHPPTPQLAASAPVDDLEITISDVSADGGAGSVVVAAEGGTIGEGFVAAGSEGPDDPEQQVVVRVFVDGLMVTGPDDGPVPPDEDCSDGCEVATFPVELDSGDHVVLVDAMTADGRLFELPATGDNPTTDRADVTIE